jgi:nucleoid DNA-binding protein
MKKPELLKALATSANVSQVQADAVLSAFATVLTGAVLLRGESITIQGLGTFKQGKSAARVGRHPSTGAPIDIPASVSIKFSMSSTLK